MELLALTQACMVGSRDPAPGSVIVRSLARDGQDEPTGSLPEVELALGGDDKVRCQNLLDRVPTGGIEPGRYVFEVSYVPGGKDDQAATSGSARFSVTPSAWDAMAPETAGPPAERGRPAADGSGP